MFAAANNDIFAFLLPFAIIGIVVAIAVTLTMVQHNRRVAALRAVAARWHGLVFNPGIFSYPHAELRIKGITARLQFTKVGKQAFTEFTINFPDPALRLEVYPQNIFHQVRKLLGMQDIEVGVSSFDDAFIIQGSNPSLIREYLSLDSQHVLVALAGFTFFHNLHLNIGGSTLRVTKHLLATEKDLLQFVTLCEGLFNALLNTRTVGIEFLQTTASAARPDSHCQVCGEGLHGHIVHCASCGTPHHLDCWQYVGHCSVYACGQRRYRA